MNQRAMAFKFTRLACVSKIRSGHYDLLAICPNNDIIGHDDEAEQSDGCVCGPTVEPVRRPDGSTGWLIIHHPLDARR